MGKGQGLTIFLQKLSLTDVVFIILGFAYLAAEVWFNINLLDVAGSVSASPEKVEHITDAGRAISACGLTLLMLGVFGRNGFVLTTWQEKGAFYAFCAMCTVPFFIFGLHGFIIFPLLAAHLLTISRGMSRIYLVLAVMLATWPSMYEGQKLIIEHAMIDKTTWQQREDARNILMLRSGIEDCIVEISGLFLCEGNSAGGEMRAVRAMITALWMHTPAQTLDDLKEQQDRITINAAMKKGWFSPARQYQEYVDVVAKQRQEAEDKLVKKYYAPYKKASDLYEQAMSPKTLEKQVDQTWVLLDSKVDQGWNMYKKALAAYAKSMANAGQGFAERLRNARDKLDALCEKSKKIKCPELDVEGAFAKAKAEADERFEQTTGYPPDLSAREDFIDHPKTREMIEREVASYAASRMKMPGTQLPSDWYYDKDYFRVFIVNLIQRQAQDNWDASAGGKVPPGLGKEAFLRALGLPALPELQDLVMSEKDFVQKMLLPRTNEIAREMVLRMQEEAPLLANGQRDEAKGKSYVRIAYIPSIALVLSLMIVSLTILRAVNGGLKMGAPQLNPMIRRAIVMVLLAIIVFGPYAAKNYVTESEKYKIYVDRAKTQNIVTANILDWAIHVQPVVYGLGRNAKR